MSVYHLSALRSLARVVFLVSALAVASPANAVADVDRGQAAPYYAAIDSWSSAAAVKKAVPGLPKVGKAKATADPLNTEQLFSLTFAPARSVTVANDALIKAKLPRGYPTSGLTSQLDKLRKSWAAQFKKLGADLENDDLADTATVAIVVSLSVYSGDKKVLSAAGAPALRQAVRQSLVASSGFSKLTEARKQSATEMLRIRALIAFNTYGEERGQKDWKGVAEVRKGLRSWMRAALGVDPATVELSDTGLTRQ